MYDFHIHSEHSIDSIASMEDMALAAISQNFKSICFTDHVDFDSTDQRIDVSFREIDYFRNIKQVKYKYARDIEILSGVEIGMQPHLFQRYNHFINNNQFDFVLMSFHSIDGRDIRRSNLLSNSDPIQLLESYYNNMLVCIRDYNNFDVIGNFDYIDRYLLKHSKIPRYTDFYPIIREILKLIIDNGKGIELNTAGMIHGLDSFHPKVEILNLYKQLGGEIITIGSNAHRPEDVGYQYRPAERLLRDLGFKYIHLFKERKKFPINIS